MDADLKQKIDASIAENQIGFDEIGDEDDE